MRNCFSRVWSGTSSCRSSIPRLGIRAAIAPLVGLFLLSGGARAGAAWNSTSIGVPARGFAGVASLYPSTITVEPGTNADVGYLNVVLYNVTHPCPRDLAVLLVHDDLESYLLMSDAASCVPFAGTTVRFGTGNLPLPATPAGGATSWGASIAIGPSISGSDPTFASPALSPPYLHALPSAPTPLQGTWKLYVMDRGDNDARGAIAGGWSIGGAVSRFQRTSAFMPIHDGGTADAYPIVFDTSAADPDLIVDHVTVSLTSLTHTYPPLLCIALEAPDGQAVLIMTGAGHNIGGNSAVRNVTMHFDDLAAASPPLTTRLVDGSYKPGLNHLGITQFPNGGPSQFASSLGVLNGQAAAGRWKLWVYDASTGGGGGLQTRLTIATHNGRPFPSIELPPAPYTSPFIDLAFDLPDAGPLTPAITWRSTVSGAYYASGAGRVTGSRVAMTVPVKKGQNLITVTITEEHDGFGGLSKTLAVPISEFKYYLSEGATGFYHTDVTVQAMGGADAPVTLSFYPEQGSATSLPVTAPGAAPLQISPNDHLPSTAFSTLIWSKEAAPLAVERGMFWDQRYYGGHAGEAVDGASRDWYFAEGSSGFFHTYLLLENDSDSPAAVSLSFMREMGGPVIVARSVPPHGRETVDAAEYPDLANTSFGIAVHADRPITAERSMYFSSPSRLFVGGHESPGVKRPAPRWFLAEGATGSFFQCYVLIGNPNPAPTTVTLSYLLETREVVTQTLPIAANARLTIDVASVDPRLVNATFSTVVTGDRDIVVERAMYWPFGEWTEAHNAFGVTESALRWGVADIRIGGLRGFDSYVLFANPNPTVAELNVTFRKTGMTPVVKSIAIGGGARSTLRVADLVGEFGEGLLSVEVEVQNYQPIIVEKAMYWNDADGVVFSGGSDVIATRLPPR